MSSEIKVAVAQLTSVDDLDLNLAQISEILKNIFQESNPQVVFFPENCLYMRIQEGEPIEGLTLSHPIFNEIIKLAKKYNTNIHLGSVPLLIDSNLYNSSVFIKFNGEIQATYQKVHLFDIQLAGQKPIRESDVFKHGSGPQVLELENWLFGQTICYDIRFSELYSRYIQLGVDVILVPAAFLVKTGEAHWEVLLRARAIESQSYVIASAQGGNHVGLKGGSRQTFGSSMVVDPWGRIIAKVEEGSKGFSIVNLSKQHIQNVRDQIPMSQHRRLMI